MGESFKQLIAWKKAVRFALDIYRLTRKFPREELYGLTSQVRRAAVSIPSNIAEGQSRYSPKDFRNFLGHSRGSLAEVETQLLIARDLGYLDSEEYKQVSLQADELGRILNGLYASIEVGRSLRVAS